MNYAQNLHKEIEKVIKELLIFVCRICKDNNLKFEIFSHQINDQKLQHRCENVIIIQQQVMDNVHQFLMNIILVKKGNFEFFLKKLILMNLFEKN